MAAELKKEGLRKEEMKTAAYLNPASLGEQNDKQLQEISAVGLVADPETQGTADEKAAGELKSGEAYYTKVVASAHNNIGFCGPGGRTFAGRRSSSRWPPDGIRNWKRFTSTGAWPVTRRSCINRPFRLWRPS